MNYIFKLAPMPGSREKLVKKYVVPNYTAENTIQKKVFEKNKVPKDIDFSLFINKEDWGDLCVLSEQEKEEVKELWKELSM